MTLQLSRSHNEFKAQVILRVFVYFNCIAQNKKPS